MEDKFVCFLVSLKTAYPYATGFSNRFLHLLTAGKTMNIIVLHRKSKKRCSLILRVSNDADHFIFWEFLGGFYEPPKSAKNIIDCGANIGLFAVHAGLVFPDAKIRCYEPDENNLELLNRNLGSNGIEAEVFQKAVWGSSGSGFFHPKQSFDGFVSSDPSPFPVDWECPSVSEDTWLKMDIEGSEYNVLPEIMKREIKPSHLSMEIHDFHKRGAQLVDLVLRSGYEIRIVTDGGPEPKFAELTANRP